MSSPNMYLENLEDYVQDQQRVVTYKWLSRQLGVPVNLSKQMLFAYYHLHGSRSGSPTKCCATFLLGGRSKGGDGTRTVFKVVPEEQLEVSRALFDAVSTEHIYSLQPSPVKDPSSALYVADYDRQQQALVEPNRWSAIQCSVIKRKVAPTIAVSLDNAPALGTDSSLAEPMLPPPTKNKPEISSASFFGSKKQSTKVTKNTKMGLKRSGSSISSILSKQASNSKSSNLANTDSKASDQVEAPKPTRKRVMVSSDEEESGTEEAVPSTKLPLKKSPKTKADLVATTPPASQSPNTVTTPTSSLDPKESPPSPLAKDIQPKKETKISAMKRKAEATKIEPQSEPQQPGLSLDEQIATMAKTKTVQKKVKKHFQNGSYMATEIVIEEVEVDLTEEEIEAEVAKLKKKFEAKQHAQTMKKAKVVGGKTGGKERPKPKQRQGSLMGFFKKK